MNRRKQRKRRIDIEFELSVDSGSPATLELWGFSASLIVASKAKTDNQHLVNHRRIEEDLEQKEAKETKD